MADANEFYYSIDGVFFDTDLSLVVEEYKTKKWNKETDSNTVELKIYEHIYRHHRDFMTTELVEDLLRKASVSGKEDSQSIDPFEGACYLSESNPRHAKHVAKLHQLILGYMHEEMDEPDWYPVGKLLDTITIVLEAQAN